MSTRTLKIEATGEFWRGEIKPKIRLTGRWPGFKHGHRVEVRMEEPGVLTLYCLSQGVQTST